MSIQSQFVPNPQWDLVLERVVPVPPAAVWRAWTDPELIVQWFTPEPWKTIKCEVDLRPGGAYFTVMQSPEGEEFPSAGCILEIVPNEKFVWTSALAPGYRPTNPTGAKETDMFTFTCIIQLEAHGSGTKYTAIAVHGDAATKAKHEAMGFHEGWGKALDQLVALMSRG